MKGLFENGLKCVYLDQFAISELFFSNDSAWNEVREQLIKGSENRRIICPRSQEHFLESSRLSEVNACHLDDAYSKLSHGYYFKPELFSTSQLIISAIRGNNITRYTYLHENNEKKFLLNKENIPTFRKLHDVFDSKISESTMIANKVRAITRTTNLDSSTSEYLIKSHKSLNVSEFISRLKDLIKDKKFIIRGVQFESGEIPHWIDLTIHRLITVHRMNLEEANRLLIHLEKYGFNKIPTLDIRTTLSAIISVYSKKETVNDQIDIMRISTGLPISDILLTDKKRKYEIVISGLDKKYKTDIYSGTKEDIELLIEGLKMLNK